jgi:hypothetical protein
VEQTEVATLNPRRHQPLGGAKPIGSPQAVAELFPTLA